ncbi:Rgp1-domain-containing protein [Dothidotthia symphoricarpi CBS 119687]|uniref:Rgp1-domain-containing protein n=1 Tax=Dothidotthia symphoricarpi CBS 119687 TaxID=1392245 RepID=A0A6A6AIB8_9PLEO|nr:Rgp1-domain-containing protein [Dothidotthia symphoricarpi CBS 119687]KAF2130983.1 Rgp1-domain-containing protein [Dothidotthia symphoricarpi CBS 119687]
MSASNIRVFVQWKDSTVFAGEDIECTITFKNVAPVEGHDSSPTRRQNGFGHGGERQRKLPPVHSSTRPSVSRNSSFASQAPPSHLRGHRPTLSLRTASNAGDSRSYISPSEALGSSSARQRPGRSLSIISLGANAAPDASQPAPSTTPRRPARGHGRSASLQVVPGRPSSHPTASPGHRSATHPSPLSAGLSTPPVIYEPAADSAFAARSPRRRSGITTTPSTPALPVTTRKPSGSFSSNFKFPAAPPPDAAPLDETDHFDTKVPPTPVAPVRRPSPRLQGESRRMPTNHNLEILSPVARILSGSSMDGTPRSSGEFYSISNNSTETLVSEYAAHPSARLLPKAVHQRRSSLLAPPNRQYASESIMMGYAQIMGSFTLDGSLINQAPFEEVKRKGVVGGQGGGGVVGVERTKRDSGLFGALGWGNLGESLGGLLGSSEPSSIREMRGIASSKTVPLITTPQSILFVDLKLAPGQSRSYTYSFTIPRGLPPSHKGRSMKVAYNLTIGTQRAGSTKDQQVRHVEVPFRVFGSVNSRGEILGHDLMSPYIILRDQARTTTVDAATTPTMGKKGSITVKVDSTAFDDFRDYVDNLLDRPRQNSSMGLLSPTETVPGRSSFAEAPHTMKEAIDTAILRSNLTGAANQSANRFEIARSGRRVAVIMLARPAYRLGETMSAVIDFTDSHIPCYSIHVSLETSEKVDPAIALRSNASIYRATKKVHASFSDNALFAQRLAFSPTIPPNATPEFITSGVNLEWKLRVEFITPRVTFEDGEEALWDDLLEEISSDDRGVVLAAAQRLPAESFEVQVPIRVYGAVSGPSELVDNDGLPV